MAEILVPGWGVLDEVVRSASESLTICTPYFTSEGVGRIFDNLRPVNNFRFWTRLSPSDWVAGVSDPEELLALLDLVEKHVGCVELGVSQRLHAKLYVADTNFALVGSSNLSGGGFTTNLEVLVRFRGAEVASVISFSQNQILPHLRSVSSPQLREWIAAAMPVIVEARRNASNQPEILAPAQARLDELLGFGGGRTISEVREPEAGDLGSFVTWLRQNRDLPGADVLLRRHDNSDGQNLTGHFKQCFFGAFRFLQRQPSNVAVEVSNALGSLPAGSIYGMDDGGLADSWSSFLDDHATDRSAAYNFSVLRGILPPSLGGTRLGGGGGSSTFKRMLPLVARFFSEVRI